MKNIGRNDPCPCGSGRKYKQCCQKKPPAQTSIPSGHGFRFEFGSYGGPGRGFMPSVICYKAVGDGQWQDHFCLVNPNRCFEDQDAASAAAEVDLVEAQSAKVKGQSDAAFALSLREKGYVNAEGFRRAVDVPPLN